MISLGTKYAFTYVVPQTCTKLSERAFSSAGPTAWNKLPKTIRIDNDTKSSKRNLKIYLFIDALINHRFFFLISHRSILCANRSWTVIFIVNRSI